MLKSKFSGLLLAVALLSGCQSSPPTEPQSSAEGTHSPVTVTTPESTPNESTPDGGAAAQGSPEAVTQAFITAAVARDLETLKTLVATDAEKEFHSLRDGTADEGSLTELSEMFTGATVGKTELDDDGQEAEVEVTLKEGQESIDLVNTPEGWKIQGF